MSNLPREHDRQNVPEEPRKQKKITAKLGGENVSPKPHQPNNGTPSNKHAEFRNSTDTKEVPEADTDELASRTDELASRTDELAGHTDKLREKPETTGELSGESDSKPNETKSIEQVIKEIQEDPDHSDEFKENVLKLIFYWKEAQRDSEKEEESED